MARPEIQIVKWLWSDERGGQADDTTKITLTSSAGKLEAVHEPDTLVDDQHAEQEAQIGGSEHYCSKPQPLPVKYHLSYDQSRLQPQVQTQNVWSCYERAHEIDFGGGYFWVGARAGTSQALVLIQREDNLDPEKMSDRLRVSESRYIVRCCEIFCSGFCADLVFENMDMSLVQIIGTPRPPTEREVLAIIGQVRLQPVPTMFDLSL